METIQVGLYHSRPEKSMGEGRKDALLKTRLLFRFYEKIIEIGMKF